jgi:hypothetical protein
MLVCVLRSSCFQVVPGHAWIAEGVTEFAFKLDADLSPLLLNPGSKGEPNAPR